MSVEKAIESRHQALVSLVQCAQYARERDMLIRRAAALGIAKKEIAQAIGLSDKQVYRIIASREEPVPPQALPQPRGGTACPKDDT